MLGQISMSEEHIFFCLENMFLSVNFSNTYQRDYLELFVTLYDQLPSMIIDVYNLQKRYLSRSCRSIFSQFINHSTFGMIQSCPNLDCWSHVFMGEVKMHPILKSTRSTLKVEILWERREAYVVLKNIIIVAKHSQFF